MGKLTRAQRNTLVRMEAGDEVWTTGGVNSLAFWHRDLNSRAPTHATLHVLQRLRLIEDRQAEKYRGAKYCITEAGRAALSQENPNA